MHRMVGSVCFATLLGVSSLTAGTVSSCTTTALGAISCTGTLGTSTDIFLDTFTVPALGATVTVQTYGFGGTLPGMTNAAGATISSGGFDSLVALFGGVPATAFILTDSSGNPIASDPATNQFSPGCPPANTVTIGTTTGVCGDNAISVHLAAGIYTLLLSDANYIPFAVSPGPPISTLLSDGFADLTGGVFQTCTGTGECILDNGNFAVDLSGLPVPVPEPGTLASLLGGLGVLLSRRLPEANKRQHRNHSA